MFKKDDCRKKNTYETIKPNTRDPSIFHPLGSAHQGFLREYPWHPYYNYMEEWRTSKENRYLDIKHLVLTNEYQWETGERDKSIDQSISIYLQNPMFIKDLELQE